MVVVRGINEYRKLQEKRIRKLREVQKKTPVTAARYMVAQVRMLAPRRTGELLSNVRRNRNVVSVSGVNRRTGFPYVHWLNETEGLNLTSWGRRYRDIPGSNRTGEVAFFTKARNNTRRFFKQSVVKATKKALRAGF